MDIVFVAGRDQSAADQPNNLAEGPPPPHCNYCRCNIDVCDDWVSVDN